MLLYNHHLRYTYDKEKGGFYAEPVVIEVEITSDNPGKHMMNNGRFTYNDFEDILSSEKFNSLILRVEDEYMLKQGLFGINEDVYANPRENYIKNVDKINIADGTMNRLGAYVRSSGQNFALNKSLYKGNNSGEYCYYIINYNFRANCKDKNINTQILCQTVIENSNKVDELPINIVPMPDLLKKTQLQVNFEAVFSFENNINRNYSMMNLQIK